MASLSPEASSESVRDQEAETMIIFACDTCDRKKKPKDNWILGFAAQNIGITLARREVSISSEWDNNSALDWLAVHFCSDECRAKYMAKLFQRTPKTLGGDETSVIRRDKKVFAGGSVETMVSQKRGPALLKTARPRKHRKAA